MFHKKRCYRFRLMTRDHNVLSSFSASTSSTSSSSSSGPIIPVYYDN